MNKILIIGQAPPAVKQDIPYGSTLLYEWLAECGISKENALEMFEFEAVYDKFPGFKEKGGHRVPTLEQMNSHWPELELKMQCADKIWVVGDYAKSFIDLKEKTWGCNTEFLYTIHPSRLNYSLYSRTKSSLLKKIKSFLNKD